MVWAICCGYWSSKRTASLSTALPTVMVLNENGAHGLIYLNAESPFIEMFGRD